MKRILTAAMLTLGFSNLGAAQEAPIATPTPAEPARRSPANMTDVTLGLAWGGPTRLTGSATVMWGEPKMLVAFAPAKLVQVRVGTRGGQLGLGLVAGVFEDSVVKPSGIAITLKAVAIRTWRDSAGGRDGNTYAGVESDVVVLGLRGSLGYAWKVAGDGRDGGRFVWSLGLGL
jgi:hypothetical protein